MKKLLTIIALAVLTACSSNTKTPSKLELSTALNTHDNSFAISGVTNLPNGTKLASNAYYNGSVVAQNFDETISNGSFYIKYGLKASKVDSVEVTIYNNELWQSKKIMEQLEQIKSDDWIDDHLTYFYKTNKGLN